MPAERSTISARCSGLVVLEPVADAEAIAQRRRQQPRPGGRADQRERRQRQGHGAGAGALAEHDRQLAVLHRRVERLLDRAAEPVDLVDEEDAAGLKRGEEGGDVGLALQRRAGGLHERHLHLGGDDVGERGLAEPRRAGEQDVVERLAAPPRRLDEDRQLLGHLLLVDEVGEASAAAASGRGPRRGCRHGRRGYGPHPRHRLLDPGGPNRLDGPSLPRPGAAGSSWRRVRFAAHAAFLPAPALRSALASSSSASPPSIPSSSCSASSGA